MRSGTYARPWAQRRNQFGTGSLMTHKERRGWLIVGSLFVELLLVFGAGYNTAGAFFFTPLLKQFNWSHAQISYLQAALALAAGVSASQVAGYMTATEFPNRVCTSTLARGRGPYMAGG
jgi:hypothetical protein